MQNVNVIKQALENAYSAPTKEITKQYFLKVLKQIKQYNLELKIFYDKIDMLSRPIIFEEDKSDITKTYEVFKKLRYLESEADKILKDGYRILDILREFFTQEKITYRIGIEYYGDLYEKTLTLEELLKYTTVSYNTRSNIDNLYKLRMTNKSNLRQAFQKAENTLVTKKGDASTIYSKVREYTRAKSTSAKDRNKGNAYEVYRLLAMQYGNRIPPAPDISDETIAETFERVRRNTISSIQGGDILTEQVKFFSSAPSLVTTANIRNNLMKIEEEFENFINTNNTQQLEKVLKQLFTKQVTDKIEQEGIKAAQKAIEERITKLKI